MRWTSRWVTGLFVKFGTTVTVKGYELLVMREEDIMGVIEGT